MDLKPINLKMLNIGRRKSVLNAINRGELDLGDVFYDGCTGKRRYCCMGDAQDLGWHVYQCPHCRLFHRTKSRSQRRKERLAIASLVGSMT